MVPDASHGYEAIADDFARARTPSIGPRVVQRWAQRLHPDTAVLDVGCGNGVPISEALIAMGFTVYGVDASASMIAKFQERFPDANVECSPAEDASFFDSKFDAAVAWGLMFLLPAELQQRVIANIARVVDRHGHFLFTSPNQPCSWMDGMTGLPSLSLGHDAYVRELERNGMVLVGNDEDEGQNYYYFAQKI
jgi:2-polyprenyl-3-methyl-5-hydroxy-6-metoxy-1,4-benzoquinol methylase